MVKNIITLIAEFIALLFVSKLKYELLNLIFYKTPIAYTIQKFPGIIS